MDPCLTKKVRRRDRGGEGGGRNKGGGGRQARKRLESKAGKGGGMVHGAEEGSGVRAIPIQRDR